MKVRHKRRHDTVFDYIEESPCYYVVSSPGTYRFLVDKNDYEPLPAPDRWEDVTGECEYAEYLPEHDGILHDKFRVLVMCGDATNYRLRKVQLNREIPDPPQTCSFPKRYKLVWAFLVERKVSS